MCVCMYVCMCGYACVSECVDVCMCVCVCVSVCAVYPKAGSDQALLPQRLPEVTEAAMRLAPCVVLLQVTDSLGAASLLCCLAVLR